MKAKKMFKKMMVYIETCESGSMFEPYEKDYEKMDVYALSAANAHESSWGCYCGSEAYVNGKNIKSCLGDLFSVNWMADTEA